MALPVFFSACAGPKIAADLLAEVGHVNEQPLTDSSVVVAVTINPEISNYEGIDETVKESLELALANANMFGSDVASPYSIDAHVVVASQAPMSFGNFEGKLEVQYIARDDQGNELLNESLLTEAGSDRWSFVGAARHRRARACNASKNVLLFVEHLQAKLEE